MQKVVRRRDGSFILHVDADTARVIAMSIRDGELNTLSQAITKKDKAVPAETVAVEDEVAVTA